MAYNPFNIFRRNQKAIFAVITVVIMFIFVLSSGMTGKADLFNRIPEWLRGSRSGDSLCEIDGDKIRPQDIEQLRFQRVIASKFMQRATMQTVNTLQQSLVQAVAQASPEHAGMLRLVVDSLNQGDIQRFSQFAGFIVRMKTDPTMKDKLKPADLNAINLVEAMANLMQSRGQIAPVPLTSDRDMIEFMLWQKKAKQLGIQYSVDDAKVLVNKELMESFKSDVEVRRALREEYKDRYSDDLLFKALAAEFDVRAAYSAIMGMSTRGDHTLNAVLLATPPYEMFEFYRDKTTPTSYQLLRVPVEAFIGQVQGTPNERELDELFKARKDYEPDPSREEPGFKEPRKIKIEWVSAVGDEPYYKKAAAEWLARTELLAKSEVRGLIVPFPGTGIAAAVHIAAPAAMKEPLVQEKYKKVVDAHQGRVGFGWSGITSIVSPPDILETSIVQPQNLAAAAGGGAGSAGFGNPFLPATLLQSASIAAEHKARVKAGLPIFLGSVPGPSLLATMLGGEAAFRKNLPPALPLEAFKPELLKELSEGKARELAVNDLKNLKKSMDELKETGKARESAARALVEEFVRTRGIKTGASTEFHSEFTMGDDPGLAPMKAVLDKEKDKDPHAAMMGLLGGPVQFGKSFFWKSNPGRSKESTTGNYIPEFYPERAAENALLPFAKPEPVFLAWRTADQPARGSSLTEAKPRVIEAWKRIKARELAKAEAERLAAEMRNKPGESEFLIGANMTDLAFQLQLKSLDPKAKELIKSFRVDNVAPLAVMKDLSGMSMGGGGGETLQQFFLAPSNEVPYPTLEMTKQLLEERTKPVKTSFVMIDQPKDNYYVAVLMDRRERSAEEFRAHVYSTLARSPVGAQLMDRQARASIIRARDTFLTLLKKEFKYAETEEQKKKLDDRAKNAFDE
jgi:hypothetical protein